jgi:hypothetical protein
MADPWSLETRELAQNKRLALTQVQCEMVNGGAYSFVGTMDGFQALVLFQLATIDGSKNREKLGRIAEILQEE